MRFRTLGPLRVWNGTSWCPIQAAHQRVVLSLLLIDAGRCVRTDRLIDEIWGACPPRTARNTIQAYVARLRRLIGGAYDDANPLVTTSQGYELAIAAADLDAGVFPQLLQAGQACAANGDPAGAVPPLSRALALWEGPAFADVQETPAIAAEVARLTQARLAALETKLGAELELGRHTEIVAELSTLASENPMREQLRGQLMLALYRSGRRAEALQVFRDARRVLVDELGIEPGQALRDIHADILRDDCTDRTDRTDRTHRVLAGSGRRRANAVAGTQPAAPPLQTQPTVNVPLPAQLPADAAQFTGRTAELRQLDDLLCGVPASTVGIGTLVGTAGVGKTALAVHWAHRVGARFPDGQLYVDLRGYADEPPLRAIDALARLLQAFGVPAARIPADVDGAAALYRSLLSGKRVLVLLDNARQAGQVRPLLPGSPGCWVLVTSREHLSGLIARDGAVSVLVGVLPPVEARHLLTEVLGAHRAYPEPAAIGELAELCGRLPLALRIAAAHLIARPGAGAAELIARLRTGNRLDALEIEGDTQAAVRAAFGLSYAGLPAEERRLFRLLGLSPGFDLDPTAVAALADRPIDLVVPGMDRLCSSHLVEDRGKDRYTLHDLLRLYAAERAAAEDDAATREAARRRLFGHYLRTTDDAAALLYANKVRLPLPRWVSRSQSGTCFDGQASALQWLDAERQNLSAVVRDAARHGPYETAWVLSDLLRGYYFARRDTVDWPVVSQTALRSAEACRDLRGQASARLNIGVMHWIHGDYDQALAEGKAALVLARKANWPHGESSVLANLGSVHRELGELGEAADCITEALRIDRRLGWRSGEASKLGNLGLLLFLLGRLNQAAEQAERAIALQQVESDRSGEAVNQTILAEICRALGRFDQARAALSQAYELNRHVGTRGNQTAADLVLAQVLRDTGELDQAFELATAAITRARDTGASMHQADALNIVGSVHCSLGRAQPAVENHQQALEIARRIGAGYTEAESLIGLAPAYLLQGCSERAAEAALAASGIARRAGYRSLEGQAQTELAGIRLVQHRTTAAVRYAQAALAIHTETGYRPGADRTTAVLQQLRTVHRR